MGLVLGIDISAWGWDIGLVYWSNPISHAAQPPVPAQLYMLALATHQHDLP